MFPLCNLFVNEVFAAQIDTIDTDDASIHSFQARASCGATHVNKNSIFYGHTALLHFAILPHPAHSPSPIQAFPTRSARHQSISYPTIQHRHFYTLPSAPFTVGQDHAIR